MELRQLTTEHDRKLFERCLNEARTTRGFGFRDTSHSMLTKAHIQFGSLYALFEDETAPTEQMVGGFIAHDLAALPLSFPKPDVGHLPARYVIEGGELWSLSRGAGRILHHVAAAVVGLLQAKAVIVYPIVEPADLTTQHLRLGFVPACEKVRFPYAQSTDGREIWVQPLILEGVALERYIGAGFDFLFHANAGTRPMLRFERDIATQGPRSEVTSEKMSVVTPPAGTSSGERNGAQAH